MAKTTSTTKAKTKTTKKKVVAKAARASKASTTKAKTTTKKVAPKKTTAKKVVKTVSSAKVTTTATTGRLSFLGRAQTRLGILYGLLAVAAGFLINTDSAQVLLGHLSKDELASSAGTALAPAAHVLYELEFRWLLVVFLAVAAVIALLRATKYAKAESAGIKNRVQPLRWVDAAITGALLFEIAALLNGVQDLVALKVGMISVVLAAYFGWIYERENAANGKPARTVLLAAQIAAVIPVAALLVTALATNVYGMVRSPWYAYAALVVFMFAVAAIPRSLKKLTTLGQQDYAAFNKTLNLHGILVKVAIATILIIGLYAQK